ncbi:MAG: SagB/ThcOx family dehydrogenase [Chloroflexi bacterium]|nr:SagB/ThcOx family dehydrogenase [Chloroflexota bacterium]
MAFSRTAAAAAAAGTLIVVIAASSIANRPPAPGSAAGADALPSPMLHGQVSLEEALAARRSVREFAPAALTDAEIGQLLWAAQGVTSADGRRTAPSAGGTYPLELLAVTASGVHRYLPKTHSLRVVRSGDVRAELAEVALEQRFVADAPLVVVVAAVPSRTAARYGARAERYVALEAGHATQNLLLQAVALGLVAVPVGAFDDAAVAWVTGLDAGEQALYLVPIGRAR